MMKPMLNFGILWSMYANFLFGLKNFRSQTCLFFFNCLLISHSYGGKNIPLRFLIAFVFPRTITSYSHFIVGQHRRRSLVSIHLMDMLAMKGSQRSWLVLISMVAINIIVMYQARHIKNSSCHRPQSNRPRNSSAFWIGLMKRPLLKLPCFEKIFRFLEISFSNSKVFKE